MSKDVDPLWFRMSLGECVLRAATREENDKITEGEEVSVQGYINRRCRYTRGELKSRQKVGSEESRD